MAIISLKFKGKTVSEFQLDKGPYTLGRDDHNDFVIDSLSVAPTQLIITLKHHQYLIENISEHFPTRINGACLTKAPVHQGDIISLAKYELTFFEDYAKFSNN